VTAAILDRLVHHSRVFQITVNSYRMKDYKLEREQRFKKKTPDDPL
jgi:DNA replication protein DnaC